MTTAGLVPSLRIKEAAKTCCGMGTAFGYDPETVELSLQMGELSLFPQIRKTGRDTLIIADDLACRRQVQHGSGGSARHTAVLLKLALAAQTQIGPADGQEDSMTAKRLSRLKRQYFK
jgi:Fe-S oxidoreductase